MFYPILDINGNSNVKNLNFIAQILTDKDYFSKSKCFYKITDF